MARIERWLIYPLMALLTWAVFASGTGLDVGTVQAGEPVVLTADTVSARSLRVVDSKGRVRAALSVDQQGTPTLELLDATGQQRASLSIPVDGKPMLTMSDARGGPRFTLGGFADGGPLLMVSDASGRTRASLGLTDEGVASLRLRAGSGSGGAELLIGEAGEPSLEFFDSNGRRRALIGPTGLEAPKADSGAAGRPPPILASADLLGNYQLVSTTLLDGTRSGGGPATVHGGIVLMEGGNFIATMAILESGESGNVRSAYRWSGNWSLVDGGVSLSGTVEKAPPVVGPFAPRWAPAKDEKGLRLDSGGWTYRRLPDGPPPDDATPR